MTIEEKLEERLRAQGWKGARVHRSLAAPGWCVQCMKISTDQDSSMEVLYEQVGEGALSAERATEIEAYFKEQLTK